MSRPRNTKTRQNLSTVVRTYIPTYHDPQSQRPKLDREVVSVEVHRGNRGGEEEEVAGPPRERAYGLGPDDGSPNRPGEGSRGAPRPLSLARVGLGRPRAPLALLQRRLAHPRGAAAGLLAAARPGRRRLQLLDLRENYVQILGAGGGGGRGGMGWG